MQAEVKAKGKCVTRNGSYSISMVRVEEESGKARISFVSSKLKRAVHAGAEFDVKAMDELAMEWVKQRGLCVTSDRVAEHVTWIVQSIKAAKVKLELALDDAKDIGG